MVTGAGKKGTNAGWQMAMVSSSVRGLNDNSINLPSLQSAYPQAVPGDLEGDDVDGIPQYAYDDLRK